MTSSSSILHIDGDDFFASLARLKNPGLRNRPVIIGNIQSRGNVVAVSYEARASGVEPGLTMGQAERLCPDAVPVQIDWEFTRQVSSGFMSILGRYSPLVEASGLDSAFIDYTGCQRLFGSPADFTRRLQQEIHEELKFTVSAGVSPDKAVSAVACRAAKQGRIEGIRPGEERRFLQSCPIGWLPGVNRNLEQYFRGLGVGTIGELAGIPGEVLEHLLGAPGKRLAVRALGTEQAGIRVNTNAGDPESAVIFPTDIIDRDILFGQLAALAGELAAELRQRRRSARRVILMMTYSDNVEVQRQAVLDPPSHRDPEIFASAGSVLSLLYRRRVRVRRMALKARYLTYCPPELPFGQAAQRMKWDRALSAVDAIRARFPNSKSVLQLGTAVTGANI